MALTDISICSHMNVYGISHMTKCSHCMRPFQLLIVDEDHHLLNIITSVTKIQSSLHKWFFLWGVNQRRILVTYANLLEQPDKFYSYFRMYHETYNI
jgi:hypothetical protein